MTIDDLMEELEGARDELAAPPKWERLPAELAA